ncbi:hypothetical protein [Flavobacterium succinicans]|uniref:hypothetical protein n=1 Tax=Flavobacterium succinicans TaxID=29536 RepID=UPI000AC9515C|nr:hypothetical protein [Flavobacterium succinicans]
MLATIIPYCKLTFFEAALQSFANQSRQQLEMYIGDDYLSAITILKIQLVV